MITILSLATLVLITGCAQKPAPKYKSKVVKPKVDNSINATYATFSQTPTFSLQKTAMLSVPLIDKDNNAYLGASVNYDIVGINNNQELFVRYQLESFDNKDTATQIYNMTKAKALVSSSRYDPYEIIMDNGNLFRAHTFDKVPYMEYKDKNAKQLFMQKLPANVQNNYFVFNDNIVMVTTGNIYVYSVDDLKKAPSVFQTKALDNKTQLYYKFTESDEGKVYLAIRKKVSAGKGWTWSLDKVALLDTNSSTLKWSKNIPECTPTGLDFNVLIFDNKLACSNKSRFNMFDLQNDKLLFKVNTGNDSTYRPLVYDKQNQIIVQTAVKYNGKYNNSYTGELILVDIKNKLAKKIKLPSYGTTAPDNNFAVSSLLDGYIQLRNVIPMAKKSPLIYVDLKSLYAMTLDDITDKYPNYPVQAVKNQNNQFLLPINDSDYDGKGDALVVNRFEVIKLGK